MGPKEKVDAEIMLLILFSTVLLTCPNNNCTVAQHQNISSTEEPDDSLLYAIVIGVLYAFIMFLLLFANIHPSRSLLVDLEQYESSTDMNLNEESPLEELIQLLKNDVCLKCEIQNRYK